MPDLPNLRVAIVDYGLGNLFSVKHACEHAGMPATITASPTEILTASAVLLPGVGAFGDAMQTLAKLDLVSVLRDIVASGKPLVGICLGMQLLMSESYEFGRYRGLDIIEGEVVRLAASHDGMRRLKVPHIGWNRIHGPVSRSEGAVSAAWEGSPLAGLSDGECMYFVHSFYPKPVDPTVILSTTPYGSSEFCSSLRRGNVFACQFHPERSGWQGLRIYRNLAAFICQSVLEGHDAREFRS